MPEGASDLEVLLQRSRGSLVAAEFLSSSGHVPLAITLATLLTGPVSSWPLIVPMLAGAFLQAWMIGNRAHRGDAPSFLLNVIGAGLFTLGMVFANPQGVVGEPLVLIYWAISLLVGGCQAVGARVGARWSEALLVGEHVVRTLTVVGVYAVVAGSPARFLDEASHRYLIAATLLVGVGLGVTAVMHRRDRSRLGEAVLRLRGWSEMLLGRSMLTKAMGRDDDLRPRRTRRSVLFADIRGFTKWSEMRAPEEVLLMLDGVYAAAESACAPFKPARTKHTGDEVMMFFADPVSAARAALAMREEVGAYLSLYGLNIGIGLHHGDVIEGLMGAVKTKAYDILGDTVNTAKRVSDHAAPGRIVVTFTFFEACRDRIIISGDQHINAKGKSCTVLVAELLGMKDDQPASAEGGETDT
jgi:adenylate cyclase